MALSKEQISDIRRIAAQRASGKVSDVKAAQSIGTDADGGFLVESKLKDAVASVLQSSVALSQGRYVGSAQEKGRVAAVGADVAPSLHSEGAVISPVDATFANTDLSLGGVFLSQSLLSREVIEDGLEPIWDRVSAATVGKLSSLIDETLIGGLTGQVNVTTGASIAAISLADVVSWVGEVDEMSDGLPSIFCSYKVAAKLRSLTNANDGKILGLDVVPCRAYDGHGSGEVIASVGYLHHRLACAWDPPKARILSERYASTDSNLLFIRQACYGGELSCGNTVWTTLSLA